ncbi:MAG TPA: hypothetical protein P5269_10190 [Syntrophales bacterium]|nr:hypothetical protein [Syntrophales bacterium]HRS87982.1 hypothetical protein [Syntrophales bacterium]HRV43605.1 hypothetical protein [Syntrophales bacterium]
MTEDFIMGGVPKRPEDIFKDYTDDYRGVFQDDLENITLFGSGARGGYVPGKSDLNFLLVLTEAALGSLERAVAVTAKWRKRAVAAPLVMSRSYIETSLDVYPVEFLDMKLHHVTVFGPDILAEIEIRRSHLRWQLERELKGKLLLLRRGFLEAGRDAKALKGLIAASLKAVFPYLASLVYIRRGEVPGDRRDLIAAAREGFGIDGDLLTRCLAVKEGSSHPGREELIALFSDYMVEVARWCRIVDELKIEA